jgi:hypothetical protein
VPGGALLVRDRLLVDGRRGRRIDLLAKPIDCGKEIVEVFLVEEIRIVNVCEAIHQPPRKSRHRTRRAFEGHDFVVALNDLKHEALVTTDAASSSTTTGAT